MPKYTVFEEVLGDSLFTVTVYTPLLFTGLILHLGPEIESKTVVFKVQIRYWCRILWKGDLQLLPLTFYP